MVHLARELETNATVRALAELVEHLGRSVQQACFAGGLKPAQWSALRYLASANLSARTVSGIAASMLTTKSTTSQTIRALRRRGLVTARRNPEDTRIVNLTLTAKGLRLLNADPLNPLVETLRGLSPEDLGAAIRIIELLIRGTLWRASIAPTRENPRPL